MTTRPEGREARPWSDILAFWFAPGMAGRWFVKDAAFDAEVRRRLEAPFRAALAGAYDDWREHPRGCVALCILLDQAPRNLFRDDPRAFASDGTALAVSRQAIARDFDKHLDQPERLFLYLPLEHAEDLALQEDSLRLMRALDADPKWHDYALRHRDIVARFGRFPHRNAVLGRVSSPEEIEFLKQDGSSF